MIVINKYKQGPTIMGDGFQENQGHQENTQPQETSSQLGEELARVAMPNEGIGDNNESEYPQDKPSWDESGQMTDTQDERVDTEPSAQQPATMPDIDKLLERIDTANGEDPGRRQGRITTSDIHRLLEAGADPNQIIERMDSSYIVNNLGKLLRAGISPDALMKHMDDVRDILRNIDALQAAGADIDGNQLTERFFEQIGNEYSYMTWLEDFLKAGANPDQIVERIRPEYVLDCLGELQAAGAHIDIETLIERMDDTTILNNLGSIFEAHADINRLIQRLSPQVISNHIEKLMRFGADTRELVRRMGEDNTVLALNRLEGLLANADRPRYRGPSRHL